MMQRGTRTPAFRREAVSLVKAKQAIEDPERRS
jgi:hypothetical protein